MTTDDDDSCVSVLVVRCDDHDDDAYLGPVYYAASV